MALHRAYAGRFGLAEAELEAAPVWPTTRAYTDFLVRTAADGDQAELVAALLPCAWGYDHIARRLAARPAPADPRYAEWVAQYASPEFAAAVDWLIAEMNRLAEGAPAAKRQRLVELFVTSGATSGSLFISSSYMGYYSSSAWRTYMDNAGNMSLGDMEEVMLD